MCDSTEEPLAQSSTQPVNDHSFCLLSLGLATASFVHMLSFPWWRGMISGQILLGSTLILFFLPRSIFALSFFLLTSLFFWFQKLPFVPNHIFFEILVHTSMLGTVLAVSICQWKRDLSSQELRGLIYEHMRPVVMSAIIIIIHSFWSIIVCGYDAPTVTHPPLPKPGAMVHVSHGSRAPLLPHPG